MSRPKSPCMRNATRMRDDADTFVDLLDVIYNANRFVCRIQSSLKAWIVSSDARRTGVPVAFERLNTAQRKYETAS